MSYEIIRQASQGMWADAHRPGGLERNMIQAEVIMAEVLSLLEQDPVGGAKSWLGKAHLSKFFWMLKPEDLEMLYGKDVLAHEKKHGGYPYRFELKDVLLSSREILMQLVADEYYMGGKESSPYTPDMFLISTGGFVDPFSTNERPDVTVQLDDEIYNEGGQIQPRPAEGFHEINARKDAQ